MAAIACEVAPADRVGVRLVAVPRQPSPAVGVYQRRRRTATALAATVLAALVVGAGVAGAALGGQDSPAGRAPAATGAASETVTVVVGPGETLWDLVRPHAPRGVDAGGYVAAVAAANDLDPRAVSPGTVVRLPAR